MTNLCTKYEHIFFKYLDGHTECIRCGEYRAPETEIREEIILQRGYRDD